MTHPTPITVELSAAAAAFVSARAEPPTSHAYGADAAVEFIILWYSGLCRAGHREAEWTADEARKLFAALRALALLSYPLLRNVDPRTCIVREVQDWLGSEENWNHPAGELRAASDLEPHDRALLAKVRRLSAAGTCAVLDAVRRCAVNPCADASLDDALAQCEFSKFWRRFSLKSVAPEASRLTVAPFPQHRVPTAGRRQGGCSGCSTATPFRSCCAPG